MGVQIVKWLRAHATYAMDPSWKPGWRNFAACHTPLLLPFPAYPLSKMKRCLCLKQILKTFFKNSMMMMIIYCRRMMGVRLTASEIFCVDAVILPSKTLNSGPTGSHEVLKENESHYWLISSSLRHIVKHMHICIIFQKSVILFLPQWGKYFTGLHTNSFWLHCYTST